MINSKLNVNVYLYHTYIFNKILIVENWQSLSKNETKNVKVAITGYVSILVKMWICTFCSNDNVF